MKKIFLASSLLLFAILVPASTSAFEIGARGYYWFPSLDGTARVDENGIVGTTVDFDKDFGIEDENYPLFEVFLGGGKHHLSFIHTHIDYSGRKRLTREIIFHGQTYSINDLVTSSIEYKMMDLLYQYDFLNLDNVLMGFSLGLVLQAKYLDGDVSLRNGGYEKEDFIFLIPMIGFNLHIGILADIIEARIRGTAVGYSGNTIYELMADISLTPLPFLDIHGGYKRFVIDIDEDIDEDDTIFDYDMSGPYLAITLSF